MYYGNLFVGKLLEAQYLGPSTITDVGTTYKLCRKSALAQLLPLLSPAVNFEFNGKFSSRALEDRANGGGVSHHVSRACWHQQGWEYEQLACLKVGGRMMIGIIFGWKWLAL